MSERISPLKVKNVFLNAQDIDKVIPGIEYKHPICPFTLLYGAVNSTETGYKPYNSVPTDYTSFSRVFTGEEPLIVEWINSITLTQPGNQKNAWTKSWQVGNVMLGYLVNNTAVAAWYQNNVQDQDVTQALKRSNTYIVNKANTNSVNFTPDSIPFNDNDFFLLYQLPLESQNNIDISTKIISGTGQFNRTNQITRQWFVIDSAINVYDTKGRYVHSIVTLNSINDRLSKTGIAIDQYVQIGGPGEGNPFPIYDASQPFKVGIDPDLIKDRPITHVQIDIFSSSGQHSLMCWGRRADPQTATTSIINAPRMLIPAKPLPPITDPIKLASSPTRNYMVLTGNTTGAKNENNSAIDIDSFFDNWKEKDATNYNDLQTKEFEGHVATDYTTTNATNDYTKNNGTYYSYFDAGWNFALKGQISMNANPYWVDEKGNGQTHGDPTKDAPYLFDYAKYNQGNFTLTQLNFYNYMSALHCMQIPWGVRETTFFQLKDIPVVGGFLNKVAGGLPFGWRDVDSKIWPGTPPLNLLWPANLYNWVNNTLYAQQDSTTTGKNSSPWPFPVLTPKNSGFIPADFFRDAESNKLGALLGATSYTNSFMYQISDIISLQPTDTTNNTLMTSEVITSDSLGQLQYNPSTDTFDTTKRYLVNDTVKIIPSDTFNKYLLDAIELKVLGKSDYKITFYSSIADDGTVVTPSADNSDAVWLGYYSTRAKASKQLMDWHNHMILSNYAIAGKYRDSDTHFTFPQQLPTPKVAGVAVDEVVNLTSRFQGSVIQNFAQPDQGVNFSLTTSSPFALSDFTKLTSLTLQVTDSSYVTRWTGFEKNPSVFGIDAFQPFSSRWSAKDGTFTIQNKDFVPNANNTIFTYTETVNNFAWSNQTANWKNIVITLSFIIDTNTNSTTVKYSWSGSIDNTVNPSWPKGDGTVIAWNIALNTLDFKILEPGKADIIQNVNLKFDNTLPSIENVYSGKSVGTVIEIPIDATVLSQIDTLTSFQIKNNYSRNMDFNSDRSTPNPMYLGWNGTKDPDNVLNMIVDVQVQGSGGTKEYIITNPNSEKFAITTQIDTVFKDVTEASALYTYAFDSTTTPTKIIITPYVEYSTQNFRAAISTFFPVDWEDNILTIEYKFN